VGAARGTWGLRPYRTRKRNISSLVRGGVRKPDGVDARIPFILHVLCYAPSRDGCHWVARASGLYDAFGTRRTTWSSAEPAWMPCHWESPPQGTHSTLTPSGRPDKRSGWARSDLERTDGGSFQCSHPTDFMESLARAIVQFHPAPGTNDLGPIGDARHDGRQLKKRYVAFLRRSPKPCFSKLCGRFRPLDTPRALHENVGTAVRSTTYGVRLRRLTTSAS